MGIGPRKFNGKCDGGSPGGNSGSPVIKRQGEELADAMRRQSLPMALHRFGLRSEMKAFDHERRCQRGAASLAF